MDKNNQNEVYKLLPVFRSYIWGGHKFFDWGKTTEKGILAEAWELSYRDDACASAVNLSGEVFPLFEVFPREKWGENAARFPEFPTLVKLIDAAQNLSVQVHPSDGYARKNHNSAGKTEMWYVIDAEKDAGLYVGFKRDMDRYEVADLLLGGDITNALNFFKVNAGDAFYIPAGTVHAIGKGVTILEVQQNSDLTYRLYDYNRVGADGKPRELHIDRALDVLDYSAYVLPSKNDNSQKTDSDNGNSVRTLADCAYFTAEEHRINGSVTIDRTDSFCHVAVIDGTFLIGGFQAKIGDTFLIPAKFATTIDGNGTVVVSFVR